MKQKQQERKIAKRKAKKKAAKLEAIVERAAFDIPKFCVAHDVGRSTVYEEIRSGRLRIMKIGKLTRITTEAAAEWRRAREKDATLDSPPGRRPERPAEAEAAQRDSAA